MFLDKEFLLKLDKNRTKTNYVRITALTWDELPIEALEGKVTGGSITIDGTSAGRRICSLSMIADAKDFNDYVWTLKTKFKLEIGLENHVDDTKPPIIWFKQGIFVITSFSASKSVNSVSISLSAKDKICLLDGSVGGKLAAPVEFDVAYNYDAEDITKISVTKVPIYNIIREAVHTYGNELYSNIIINDVDLQKPWQQIYLGEDPIYIYMHNHIPKDITTDAPDVAADFKYDLLFDDINVEYTPDTKTIAGVDYTIAKITSGDAIGYRLGAHTYPGENGSLSGGINDSVKTILDKILQMFANYEYFYDIDGHFVFQQRKDSIYSSWNSLEIDGDTEIHAAAAALSSPYSYVFESDELITQLQNTPQLDMIKNDFSIWGKRSDSVPVHARFAIDEKPAAYTNYNGITFAVEDGFPWQEILYQMARDRYHNGQESDFIHKLIEHNPQFYTGRTGYEQYYVDIFSFWRELYDPHFTAGTEWNPDDAWWNPNIKEDPGKLNFWLEFIDKGSIVENSVKKIGCRMLVENNDNVNCVYVKQTPTIIYYTDNVEQVQAENNFPGYRSMSAVGLNQYFHDGSAGLGANEIIDEKMYTYLLGNETVTFQAIPIYYLEPNTRIKIEDKETKMSGDYRISKINLSLNYNATMSVTATRVQERIV